MLLTQSKYIRDLLFLANMIEVKGISTPMVSTTKMSRFGTNTVSNPHEYKSIVGAFQYLALTRPDITFSVNKVCQNMSNPLQTHRRAVKRILRYLEGTLHHGLLLHGASPDCSFSLHVLILTLTGRVIPTTIALPRAPVFFSDQIWYIGLQRSRILSHALALK